MKKVHICLKNWLSANITLTLTRTPTASEVRVRETSDVTNQSSKVL